MKPERDAVHDPRQRDLFQSPRMAPRRTPRTVSAPHPPSHPSSDTSAIAADRIAVRAGTIRARVLAFVVGRSVKGATQEEASIALGIPRATVCARFWELAGILLIQKSDETRLTTAACPAAVYYATAAGLERCALIAGAP